MSHNEELRSARLELKASLLRTQQAAQDLLADAIVRRDEQEARIVAFRRTLEETKAGLAKVERELSDA